MSVPFFPIYDGHFVATDCRRSIDLPKIQIEPALADGFADRPWMERIVFYTDVIWSLGATNPTQRCPTKWQ
jgi:hypothetical protein